MLPLCFAVSPPPPRLRKTMEFRETNVGRAYDLRKDEVGASFLLVKARFGDSLKFKHDFGLFCVSVCVCKCMRVMVSLFFLSPLLPKPRYFLFFCGLHGCPPSPVWVVGDSWI